MSFRDRAKEAGAIIENEFYRPSEETNNLTQVDGGYNPNIKPSFVETMFNMFQSKPTPTATATIQTTKTETFGLFVLLILGVVVMTKL
ncbi:hypothetical protein GOV14_03500 [Candidatus Pacearchaeota archaeon]|nr:hypothetical protein [Candidatus Pacearchaeota archaeon]